MVSLQIIPNASVTLVRTVRVDLFGKIRNVLVLFLSLGKFSGKPVIVSISGYMQNATAGFYGITVVLMAVPDRYIQIALSYLRKASLLSSSSTFFNRSRSILVM